MTFKCPNHSIVYDIIPYLTDRQDANQLANCYLSTSRPGIANRLLTERQTGQLPKQQANQLLDQEA
jgi:hypothetical protein